MRELVGNKRNPQNVGIGDMVFIKTDELERVFRCAVGGTVWIGNEGDIHGTALFEELRNLVGGDER